MATLSYKTGKVQAVAEKHGAQMSSPQRVTPAMLQTCLSYSLVARLAPNWNKAGHLLIKGRDFLSKSGRQDAIEMDLNVSDKQLCISIQVYTIRLPPSELEDFNIATGTLQNFINNNNSVIQKHFIPSNWCYILPSMKMGQIVSISHGIPPQSPFQTYEDFQIYWSMLYGYELPRVAPEGMIYCSVYFKLVGERLFTYPFICIRSQPLQFFPRVNLAGVLGDFVTDLKVIFTHLCGFPVEINEKQWYPVKALARPQSQQTYPSSGSVSNPKSVPTYHEERIDTKTSELGHGNSINISHKRKEQRDNVEISKKIKEVHKPSYSGADCKNLTVGSGQTIVSMCHKGDIFEAKPKKPKNKPAIQDVDVEMHARNNQLSKLNNVTLQEWLRKHGISVKTREKKEELVTKIMLFVNEC
ncbi:uncharacterized protein C18orf63 homolog [Discoglossus pictus]